MSDKNLTELEWKKFSKGKGFKDSAFVKALAALEKAKTPDLQLDALAEIEKQADALRKAGKSDKELAAYLDGLDKALDKDRKLAEFEARKAAKAAEAGDEEEETPALLTTKMIPLLRQVRKGETMNVMLGVVGKEVGVLISRRPIAPTRRKLITDYVNAGTLKFFPGTCIFEENAYTFVMKTQAGGLAKKVKAALLKQVELRLKVRVRGEDPNDIDDDGDPAEEEEAEDGKPKAEAPKTEAPKAGVIPPAPPLPPTRPGVKAQEKPAGEPSNETAAVDPLKATFESRMAAIEPRVLAALRDQLGDVSKIRAVAAFVREKGDSGQYKPALAGMDSLAKLLEAANGVPEAPPMKAPEVQAPVTKPQSDEAAAFNARLAALMPAVKAAVAAGGEHAQDIKLKVSEAGVYARKQTFDQAHTLLDEAEKLLGDGRSAVPEAPPLQNTADAPKASSEAASTAFNKRLAALMPGVRTATGPVAADFKKWVTEAASHAQKKDFATADSVLDEIEKVLANMADAQRADDADRAAEAEESEETERTEDDPEDEAQAAELNSAWDARFEAVESFYLETLRRNPAGAGELRTVMAYAVDQNEDGQTTKALAALDRLEKLMSGMSSKNEAGYKGIVEYRKSLLDLRGAVAKVDGKIAALLKAIPEDSPEEADLAQELADQLTSANEELQDLVDDAMGTAEDEDTPVTRALRDRLDLLIGKVADDELIKHVDKNPFTDSLLVEETLTVALMKVRASLPVPA